jgi:TatD DNase family protein
MYFIDSHTHLDGKDFDEDREQVIERALNAGVRQIVNIGATDGFLGAERSIKLADSYEAIFLTVGIHPHDATETLDIERLKELAQHPKVVAIGETGLDFYRDWSPKDRQYEWFRAQVELALELQKPIVVHSRSAATECLEVLQELNAEQVGGVFHCYSEDVAFEKQLREMSFLISVPGTITFKKAEEFRDIIREIPLERIMIETDAPYLAPTPFRGKRCESAYVVHTAQQIADIKEVSLKDVARVTSATARAFYGLPEVEV